MNKVILVGRLTRDPEVRYLQNEKNTVVARFTLAVDRKFKKDGEQSADFINCVAFGGTGEFLEKYGHKGTKFVVEGRIQTGSYTNKDGQRVNTTDVMVESVEFAESKNGNQQNTNNVHAQQKPNNNGDGFVNIPDGIDEEFPFN